MEKEWESKCALIQQREHAEIRNALLGGTLANELRKSAAEDMEEEIVAQRGDVVNEEIIDSGVPLEDFQVTDSEAMERIARIRYLAKGRVEALTTEKEAKIEKIRKGDELKPGVIKLVKVYVANRRKIAVGDKIAGRHGNKGVVAKILPPGRYALFGRWHPCRDCVKPIGRALAHECRTDSRNTSRMGG